MNKNKLQDWCDKLEGTRQYEPGFTEESVDKLLQEIFEEYDKISQLVEGYLHGETRGVMGDAIESNEVLWKIHDLMVGVKTVTKRISETCKYFKDCPHDYGCLDEIARYGSCLWSVELCYDLKELQDAGLVSRPPKYWIRLRNFFESTFNGRTSDDICE